MKVSLIALAILALFFIAESYGHYRYASGRYGGRYGYGKSRSRSSSSGSRGGKSSKSKSSKSKSSKESPADQPLFSDAFIQAIVANNGGSYFGSLGLCEVSVKVSKRKAKLTSQCTATEYKSASKRCQRTTKCQQIAKLKDGVYTVSKSECERTERNGCQCYVCKRNRRGEKCSFRNCPRRPKPERTCSERDAPSDASQCDSLLNEVQACVKAAAENTANLPDSQSPDIRPVLSCLGEFGDIFGNIVNNILFNSDDFSVEFAERQAAIINFANAETANLQALVNVVAQSAQALPNENLDNAAAPLDYLIGFNSAVTVPSLDEYSASAPTYANAGQCDSQIESDLSACTNVAECITDPNSFISKLFGTVSNVSADCQGNTPVANSIGAILDGVAAILEAGDLSAMTEGEAAAYTAFVDEYLKQVPQGYNIPDGIAAIAEAGI